MAPGRHSSLRTLATIVALLAIALAGCGSSADGDRSDQGGPASALALKIDAAQTRATDAPTDPQPLADLAKAHFQLAGLKTSSTGAYTDDGKAELRLATAAWERYVALDPDPLDTGVAQLIAAAYGPGSLDRPKKAVEVQQVLTAATSPPSAALFAQLAQMAYYAGETRTAELAADRAIELTPARDRATMRDALATARSQLTPAQP